MVETIIEMLSHAFIQRAILVGTLISLCAALLGVSLVLKRYSMIGDGLSHVGFGVISVATALGISSPLYVSLPIVMIVAIILLKIGNNKTVKSDSAIALISSGSLAIGVTVVSLTTGMNTDTCNFMFGSILAMSQSDVFLSIFVSILVCVLFVVYYRKLFIVTFDEEFAKASGLDVSRYTNMIAILSSIVIVVGMRLMGTMLISSIIILPALSSMQVFKTFKKVVITSGIISVTCFLIGIYFSYTLNVSTGAMIVLVNLIVFVICTILNKILNE